ncbi:uncharacterized protein LOC135392334 [Ornithodoros turicata]|uniref:uncharacterized protein LOC135392334 n=1 Tax=Ornithodoros turicata TaxID=34597 RepID=UPI0031388F63
MHILVKWLTEDSWDVYDVRMLVDVAIGFRLMADNTAIDDLRGSIVSVKWKDGEPPSSAKLLDCGTEKVMERRRARLAKRGTISSSQCSENGTEGGAAEAPRNLHRGAPKCKCEAQQKVQELQDRITKLEEDLRQAQNNYDSYRMVQNLRKITKRLEASQHSTPVEAEKVNIGGGVLVEKTSLDQLHSHCRGAPTKFARGLLRILFPLEELQGKSLFGKGSNANKDGPIKEALDPVRINALIGYVCSKFDTTVVQLKNSLSSMISRELK